ncbi:MAG TPA: S1C family serine protease [Candidatus Paceibacterota bacterium]
MKKLLLIFVFTASVVVPLNFVYAITQTQISSEVQIVCPDNYGNWYSGSGTIIDSKGIILTNKHVVTDQYGDIISACFIGFVSSANDEPDFGTENNYNFAEVKYYTTTSDMDAAILYLYNPTNKTYPYINIWRSDSSKLQFGDKIEVIGYPSIGGSTITYTSGDFSGFGGKSDGTQNYLKTTAILEHGNSGGAAYNPKGQFIGIPTMVVSGTLNSLSYILSVNSIKNWLSNVLGSDYKNAIINQTPSVQELEKNIQADIAPPKLKSGGFIDYNIINNTKNKKSYIRYNLPISNIQESGMVMKVYYYFGRNKSADPLLSGSVYSVPVGKDIQIPKDFLLRNNGTSYLIIKLEDDSGNISTPIINSWQFDDAVKVGIENSIYNQALLKYKKVNKSVFNKYKGLFVRNNKTIWWVSPKQKVRYFVYHESLDASFLKNVLSVWFNHNWGKPLFTGIFSRNLKLKPKNVWGHLLNEIKDDGSGVAETRCGEGCYINPKDGKLIYLGEMVNYKKSGKEALLTIKSLVVDIPENDLNLIEPLGKSNDNYKRIKWAKDHNQLPLYIFKQ